MSLRATINQSVQLAAIDVRLRFNLVECFSAGVKFDHSAARAEYRAIAGASDRSQVSCRKKWGSKLINFRVI